MTYPAPARIRAYLHLRPFAIACALSACLIVCLGSPAFATNRVFFGAATTNLPFQPQSVTTGDLNGDGKLDVIITDYTTNQITVLLGNGDGTFQTHQEYPAGSSPWALAVGDFNGDGKLDVVVTNYYDSTVSVLLGNGDGTLQGRVAYTAGIMSISIAAADLNHDGKLDLVTGDISGAVVVLLGIGDGSFGSPKTYPSGGFSSSVLIADFNGDGIPDIAVYGAAVILGNGDGTFGSPIVTPTDGYLLAAADLNRDGKLDLVTAGTPVNQYYVLLGSGDGAFNVLQSHSTLGSVAGLALADFDGDGKVDMVGTSASNYEAFYLPGNGDGNFGNDQRQLFPVTDRPSGLAVGDFNGDGYPDVVVVAGFQRKAGESKLNILLNAAGVVVPKLSVPSSLDFGSRLINTKTQLYVDLNNTGTGTLNLSSITFTTTSSALTFTNNCGATIAAGSLCFVQITFSPVGRGTYTASLTIVDDAAGSPQTVSITAVATALTPPPSSLNFGTVRVGTSVQQSFTLSNQGGNPIAVGPFSITGVNKNDYTQTNTCGTSIVTGHPCNVTVTFTPAFPTNRNATLNIPNSGSGTNVVATVALTGKGY